MTRAAGNISHSSGPGARPVRCAVVGAAGYSGAEVVSILLGHDRAEVVGVFGSDRAAAEVGERSLGELFPRLRGRCELPVKLASVEAILAVKPDAVFLATPHAASHDLAPRLADHGVVVLDLSAAYRLKDGSQYPAHYGFQHGHLGWLDRAVYGLVELQREKLRGAVLIAVPGCYPTSAILPLAPLIKAGALDLSRRPIVDSTSGVSGAGRTPSTKAHFCEVSLQPYEVFTHRHCPEIDAYTGATVVFTPHLGAYERGILSTIHVELASGWNAERVGEVYSRTYGSERFVRLLPKGQWPSVGAVRGTNLCDIAWASEGGHLIIVSAIDNLVKGAAGQAVQSMNVRFGFPEGMGLIGRSATAVTS